MRKSLLIENIVKKLIVSVLTFSLVIPSAIPIFNTPFSPKVAFAQDNACLASAAPGKNSISKVQSKLIPRVGGVALDQAAKFLADMSEVTGAYYDSNLDRIVFVGKKNIVAPKLDRDDMAVAIKAIMFNGQIPYVSIEGTNPDPNLSNKFFRPQ